jgi:hypothetical protein
MALGEGRCPQPLACDEEQVAAALKYDRLAQAISIKKQLMHAVRLAGVDDAARRL